MLWCSISALELFGSLPKNKVTRGWFLSLVQFKCDSPEQQAAALPAVRASKLSAARRTDAGRTAKVCAHS